MLTEDDFEDRIEYRTQMVERIVQLSGPSVSGEFDYLHDQARDYIGSSDRKGLPSRGSIDQLLRFVKASQVRNYTIVGHDKEGQLLIFWQLVDGQCTARFGMEIAWSVTDRKRVPVASGTHELAAFVSWFVDHVGPKVGRLSSPLMSGNNIHAE